MNHAIANTNIPHYMNILMHHINNTYFKVLSSYEKGIFFCLLIFFIFQTLGFRASGTLDFLLTIFDLLLSLHSII